jgi:hypothetical protein
VRQRCIPLSAPPANLSSLSMTYMNRDCAGRQLAKAGASAGALLNKIWSWTTTAH